MTDTDRNGVAPATVEVQASRGEMLLGKSGIDWPPIRVVARDEATPKLIELEDRIARARRSLLDLTWGELIGGCILLGAIAGLVLAAILAGGAR